MGDFEKVIFVVRIRGVNEVVSKIWGKIVVRRKYMKSKRCTVGKRFDVFKEWYINYGWLSIIFREREKLER